MTTANTLRKWADIVRCGNEDSRNTVEFSRALIEASKSADLAPLFALLAGLTLIAFDLPVFPCTIGVVRRNIAKGPADASAKAASESLWSMYEAHYATGEGELAAALRYGNAQKASLVILDMPCVCGVASGFPPAVDDIPTITSVIRSVRGSITDEEIAKMTTIMWQQCRFGLV